jgi:thiamine-phosphate pyrophosphorylase
MARNLRDRVRLIGIADAGLDSWEGLEARCRAALAAGLPALMLRDRSAAADADLLPAARRLAAAAREAGALLIVNRRLELARAIGAEAVHLGRTGGPTLEEARAALGEGIVAGYAAHSEAEAMAAFGAGFQYVTLSPIFETPSKPGAEGVGLGRLEVLCGRAPGPVVALGGIDAGNAADAMRCGAAGVATIRGVFASDAAENVRGLLGSIRRNEGRE